jgi:serine/threonine-protein kinase RIO1
VPRPADYNPETIDMPTLEAMIALRKRELVQTVIKTCRSTLEEAVAYLQLADWDSQAAIKMYKSDETWAEDRFDGRPRTLDDFVSQCRALESRKRRGMGCVSCSAVMRQSQRVHCVG